MALAQKNADKLNAGVSFQLHDILNDPMNFGQLDLIVSNPPYIGNKEKAAMAKNVVDYEPASALFVKDSDPLIFYRSLAVKGLTALKNQGHLIVEINERFGTETALLLESLGYKEVNVIKDTDGKDRVISATAVGIS